MAECTDQLIADVSATVELGVPPLVACMAEGVTEEQFAAWLKKAREGGRGSAPYKKFAEAIRVAEARAEGILIGRIRTAARTNWSAAAWLAERRFPQRYTRRSVNEERDEDASGDLPRDDPFEQVDNVLPIRRRKG